MMCQRKHYDAFGFGPVHHREWKALDDNAASVGRSGRASHRKSEGANHGLLNCCREALAQTGLGFVVVNDFCEELEPCCGDEPRPLHLPKRLASSRTSSAA